MIFVACVGQSTIEQARCVAPVHATIRKSMAAVSKDDVDTYHATQIKLVLERVERPLSNEPIWYNIGEIGIVSSTQRDTLQLPVKFISSTSQEDDWSQELVAPGRCLSVGFHRSLWGKSHVS